MAVIADEARNVGLMSPWHERDDQRRLGELPKP